MGQIHFFCLHRITCLRIPTVTQPQSYFLLEIFHVASILLSVCMVDHTQTYPSSILPLGLFQGII